MGYKREKMKEKKVEKIKLGQRKKVTRISWGTQNYYKNFFLFI